MASLKQYGFVILAGLVLATTSLAGEEKKKAAAGEDMEKEPKIAIGAQVPDFTLKDSEGKEVNLTKYRGDGIVVLTFVSKQCPIARALTPTLVAYEKEYGAKGVKFLGIMSNVTEETPVVAASLKENGIAFPILDDPGYKIADALDAMGTPHMYIIDKQGKLRYSGAVNDNWKEPEKVEKTYFKTALESVLAGKTVAEPSPDAFIGCSIKRQKQVG
jgi:peroxiredoxin